MSDERICRLVVRGSPAPQGSKRFVGVSKSGKGLMVESSKAVKPWRQDVKAAAELWIASQACQNGPWQAFDGPLVCRIVFTLKKPATAPKTRRTYPTKTPDLSKLLRSTEDALTDAGLWADDSRVVEYQMLAKRYPGEGEDAMSTPGAIIEIRAL